MIKIICLGKIKEKYLKDLIDDYQKRMSHYHKIEIVELNDSNDLKKEALDISRHIGPNEYLIALDIQGTQLTSEKFAKKIDETFITHSTITFLIGSSNGLDKTIKEKSNFRLSFSSLTFPHGLFRGLLLEQIYRAFKILNHETYHK